MVRDYQPRPAKRNDGKAKTRLRLGVNGGAVARTYSSFLALTAVFLL
jgi:hypothetical protein